MRALWRRLRVLLRRSRFDNELEEEIESHLDMQAEEHREGGMEAAEAGYAARRQFGNVTLLREASREAWGWAWLDALVQDVKYAARTMRASPGFTAVAVLTLALGIGANTAVFSVVNAVLLRPLSYRDPDRLVMIWEKREKRGDDRVVVSPGNFADWRDQSKSFERMAAIAGFGPSSVIMIEDEPMPLTAVSVTEDFFDTLGTKPFVGRTFVPEQWRGVGQRVAILGHGLWQRLGGDRKLIGKTMQLDYEPHLVVGVMPPGFEFPNACEAWFPLPEAQRRPDERGNHFLRVIGKLRAPVSLEQARSEMEMIAARLRQAYPKMNEGIGVTLVPLHEQIAGEARRALLVMLGAVGCVLLIACANVANLLLARAAGRRREFALRVALGAGRWRVIRHLLTESVLLSVAGGALGLAAAASMVRAFVAFDPLRLPRIQEVGVAGGVLLFTLIVAVGTGLLFGMAPALSLSRPDLNEFLKEGARGGAGGGFRRNRGRGALAVVEIALAIVLMVCAGLLVRSFVRRVTVPLGFRPDGVLAVELPWGAHRRVDQLLERLRALPGVEAAGAGTAFPHEPAGTSGDFDIEGRPKAPGEELMAGKMVVTPDYFRAAGITLLRGRLLAGADAAGAPPAAVINETLARLYFPGQDPIGRRIREGSGAGWPIVGVVGNVKGFGVAGDPMPMIYRSHQQVGWSNPVLVLLRTRVPPASLAGAVRQEIRLLSKRWVIERMGAMEDLLWASVTVPRFYTLLVGLFAALAVTLAAVGVYGVIDYSVAQRTHEIGVRMALGAERSDVLQMVLAQGFALILAGVGLGLAGAWASTRLLESLLFRVRPDDAGAFAAASLALVAVGLAACYIPALRATRIAPIEALRYE